MNELNIYQLYKDIIALSKVMKRFVIAPGYGSDLNKDNLGDILKDAFQAITDGEKYPVCLMFPPVEFPSFDNNWAKFNCKMFFLTQPYSSPNGIANRNPFNGLSQHTIQHTWKDMNVCAKSFYMFLQSVVYNNPANGIRIPESAIVIQRFSNQANDNVSGVSLTFDIDIAMSCEIEDYNSIDIENFQINKQNIHPHHEY